MKLVINNDILDARIGVFNLRNLKRLDWTFAGLVLILAAMGILTLISANRSFSFGVPYYFKQIIFLVMGCSIALFIACLDHRYLVSLAPVVFACVMGLLLAVLFFGYEARGGQRWLSLGSFRLQPSELAKPALALMLAWYLGKIAGRVRRLPYFLLAFVIAAVPTLLILNQPNLGTALVLVPILFSMLYAAGCKRRHLAGVTLVALAIIPLGWTQLHTYQKTRLLSFIDPSADPQGSGYHTIQSMITVGSGGFSGRGYFQGTQTYLSYLPEHHSDFIFSLLAEEWGFLGAVTIIGLYALFLLRGLSFARTSTDRAGALLSVGLVAFLGFHVFVNIAITLGLMPVTGIPLPFLSYGGSFYLTVMTSVGLLLSVNVRKAMFSH